MYKRQTIDTSETVEELATLSADGGTNDLTIVISGADATAATAAQLNTINDATALAVNLTNVTALRILELWRQPSAIVNSAMRRV